MNRPTIPNSARRTPICAVVVATLVWGIAGSASAAVEDESAAKEVISDTVGAVIDVLRSEDATSAKQYQIEQIVYARFDFDTISKLVLARNWKKLSASQRDDFVIEFKHHLSLTYGRTLKDYKDQKVNFTSTRSEKNKDVTVRTQIKGSGAEPILVDYRLRKASDDWRVIDVIIEGVSLIQNFRAQTQDILSDVGPEKLIEKLRQKNAEREAKSS